MDAFAIKNPRLSAEVGLMDCPTDRTPEEVWAMNSSLYSLVWVSLLLFGLLTMVVIRAHFTFVWSQVQN